MPNFTITLGVPIEAIKQEKKSIQSKNKAIKLSHSQMMYVYSNINTGRASWESFRSWGCTLKGFHGTPASQEVSTLLLPSPFSFFTKGLKAWTHLILDRNLQKCEENKPFLFIS
jgi:hypothetical protein